MTERALNPKDTSAAIQGGGNLLGIGDKAFLMG